MDSNRDIDYEMIVEQLVCRPISDIDSFRLLSLLVSDSTTYSRLLSRFKASDSDLSELYLSLEGAAPHDIGRRFGLDKASAVRLCAFAELVRRHKPQTATLQKRASVFTRDDVVAMFSADIVPLPYEEMWVVLLNGANRVIERFKASSGGLNATVIDNRVILKRAVDTLAASLILVHNHPSGNPSPSSHDRQLTDSLRVACGYFNVRLFDHIIISEDGCFSFAESGLL